MPKICILSTRDHRRHVVIGRLINTLLESGFDISIVDQDGKQSTELPVRYRYLHVDRLEWQLLVKNIWRVIRRIQSNRLHGQFWRWVLWLLTSSNAIRMARVALHENPDYYIGWDLQSTWAAMIASRFRRRPIIYCADELESEQGDLVFARRSFFQSLEKKLVPRVDYLVTPNHSRARFYVTRYGVQTDPIIVHNCPPEHSLLRGNKLRETLGLASSIRVVLYHGALIPYRSLDKLVESAAFFEEDIALVFIGEQGSYFKDVLMPLLKIKDLQGRIFFLPYVAPEEIVSYVASADLGIVIYENVNLNNYLCAPLKLYEFIMMKVPVAACNFPELEELFKQYPIGVTFEPGDPISIAEAVNSYFAKSEDDITSVQDALDRARQQFTWEKESINWLNILNSA